jgi:hypothetical protein
MKKVFALLLVAGMFAVVSCGPSAEEKAKKEQATKDSIANVEKAKADSIATAEKAVQDSIAAVAETAKADSIKAAEEKGAKGAKGAKTTVKKENKKETVGTKVDKAVTTAKKLKG